MYKQQTCVNTLFIMTLYKDLPDKTQLLERRLIEDLLELYLNDITALRPYDQGILITIKELIKQKKYTIIGAITKDLHEGLIQVTHAKR